jgi:hypothetical protein
MLAFEFGGQCTAGHPNGDYYYSKNSDMILNHSGGIYLTPGEHSYGFKRQSYYKFIMDKTGIEKREKYSYHEFVQYH